MPAADPDLHHHGPVVLPEDPMGIAEPHDVLAAEEFPMPAVHGVRGATLAERTEGWRRPVVVLSAALAVLMALRALLRRH